MPQLTGPARLFRRPIIFGDNLAATGSVMFGGTASLPIVEDRANVNFLNFYFKSTATSGTNRGLYQRFYIAGAGVDSDGARFFTTVSDVSAVGAKAMHTSLSFGTSGNASGEGTVSRSTLQIPNGAMTGGTYSVVEAELWSDGNSSTPAAVTELSLFRCVNAGGNATSQDAAQAKAALFSFSGFDIAGGNMLQAKSAAAVTHTLRILVDGVPYYIMVSNAN